MIELSFLIFQNAMQPAPSYAGGFTSQEIKDAVYSALVMKDVAGLKCSEFVGLGFPCADMKAAEFVLTGEGSGLLHCRAARGRVQPQGDAGRGLQLR